MKKFFMTCLGLVAAFSAFAWGGNAGGAESVPEKEAGGGAPAKVYFIKDINARNLVRIYEALGREAAGKVAVKLSTGEPGNDNYLDPQLIKEAVRSVMEGRRFFCPRFRRLYARLVQRSGRPGREGDAPTARELEVLRAIARGLRTSEIAERLFISENTVETHRKNLMLKLGARNSADLVMRAVERGFLRVPCD